jgi:hypothetical protein
MAGVLLALRALPLVDAAPLAALVYAALLLPLGVLGRDELRVVLRLARAARGGLAS